MTALQSIPNRRIGIGCSDAPIPQQAHGEQIPSPVHTRSVKQSLRDVWQDNSTPQRDRAASPQPAPHKNEMRPHQLSTNPSRSQTLPKKRKTVHLTLWVKPSIKAELQRIAEQKALSISITGAAFLESALQQNLHTQHTALLDSIINKAIGKHMRSYSNRLAFLLVRSSFISEQTRSIVTNILGKIPGITQAIVHDILNKSSDTAKRNITRKTPQLESVITEVEKWMLEEEKPYD